MPSVDDASQTALAVAAWQILTRAEVFGTFHVAHQSHVLVEVVDGVLAAKRSIALPTNQRVVALNTQVERDADGRKVVRVLAQINLSHTTVLVGVHAITNLVCS